MGLLRIGRLYGGFRRWRWPVGIWTARSPLRGPIRSRGSFRHRPWRNVSVACPRHSPWRNPPPTGSLLWQKPWGHHELLLEEVNRSKSGAGTSRTPRTRAEARPR